MDTAELKGVVESLIFISETPVRCDRLAETLEIDRDRIRLILKELVSDYSARCGGVVLQEVADGYQFRTRPEHAEWVRRFQRSKPFRFSRPALETLAIIAYRQPVTRAEVEYLRGVDSGGVVKTLLDKRLIRILGKKDVPGRPMIYGTTREFLEFFGLNDLSGLPALREFSELTPETSERFASFQDVPVIAEKEEEQIACLDGGLP